MNLYNIEQKFLQLFNEIEENEGEITEELQQQLEINENDFKDKLNNYYKIILQWKGYCEQLKAEKCRINDRKNSYENKIKSISNTIIDALEKFGEVNKSGNAFIELPEAKLLTRHTLSAELDENRIKVLIEAVNEVMRDIHNNSTIALGEESDVDGLLNVINANAKAIWDAKSVLGFDHFMHTNFIPYTFRDLKSLPITINVKSTLYDWISSPNSIINEVYNSNLLFDIIPNLSLTEAKRIKECYNEEITITKINENKSLNIK